MPEPTPEEIKAQSLEELKHNEYMKRMIGATGKSIDQILEPETDATKLEADKSATPPAKTPDQIAADEKAAADKLAADQAAEAEAKKKSEPVIPPVRPVVVQKRESPEQKQKIEEDAAAKKLREEEEAYVASLSEDRRDSVEIARFAETKGKTGVAKKLLDTYRKLDAFNAENPEAEAGDEDRAKIEKELDGIMTPGEIKRMEREMITERAVAQATEKARKDFEPVERELNELRNEPVVKAVLATVESVMVKKPEGESEAINPEVYRKVQSMPYKQALDEFPVEAPIVAGTVVAVQEWTKIWIGTVEIDEKNPTHTWLMNRIAAEETKMLARPKAEQMRDGKEFMPLGQYENLRVANPAKAAGYYSFDHAMIVERIAHHGVEQYNQQLKKLAKSGFTRTVAEKKTDTTELKKEDDSKPATAGGPKPGGHTMIGAGAESNNNNGLDSLPPHMRNAAKLMNVS